MEKLSKNFFAQFFNVPEERLEWAILTKMVSGELVEQCPCLMLKNSRLAIDIFGMRLRSRYHFKKERVSFFKAAAEKEENSLWLKNGNMQIKLTEEDIDNVYHYRWYDGIDDDEIIL